MLKKIYINALYPEEVRIAFIENGILENYKVESLLKEQIRGNIFRGTVVNVEKGLQAAFVDLGFGKPGFLPVKEVHPAYFRRKKQRKIDDALKVKDTLTIQVIRDEIGSKGPTLSTFLSIAGRYLVLMPKTIKGGVSRKIEDSRQRTRLKEIISQINVPENFGIIVRTAGYDREKEELETDLSSLLKIWEEIESKEKTPPPALLYHESDFVIRTLRDYFENDVEAIYIDSRGYYKKVKDFFKFAMPAYERKIKLFKEKKPIFSAYNIEDQIEKIYNRSVFLKSGGEIVIDRTEALVSIDVNSGKYKIEKDIEETAFKTNIEAADEIARQLRLRELGGLIAIDFIDMQDKNHALEVEKALKNAVKRDKARVDIGKISQFGIIELSRQKKKSSAVSDVITKCPHCDGTGLRKTVESTALSILRKIHYKASKGGISTIKAKASQQIANFLLNFKRAELDSIEKMCNCSIYIIGTESLKDGNYEIDAVKKEQGDTLKTKNEV